MDKLIQGDSTLKYIDLEKGLLNRKNLNIS